MSVVAELFDGTELEFPDDTPPSVIQGKVKEITAARRQAAPALGQEHRVSMAGPEPSILDPLKSYGQRTARLFNEAAEQFYEVPKSAKELVTGGGEGGRTQSLLRLLGGVSAPFQQLSAPIQAAFEEAAAGGLGLPEDVARGIGVAGDVATGAGVGLAAKAGKLTKMGELFNQVYGVGQGREPGSLLAPGDVRIPAARAAGARSLKELAEEAATNRANQEIADAIAAQSAEAFTAGKPGSPQAGRARAIDAALTEAERVRQSQRGGQLLRRDLEQKQAQGFDDIIARQSAEALTPGPSRPAPKIDPTQERIASLERENELLRENAALRSGKTSVATPQEGQAQASAAPVSAKVEPGAGVPTREEFYKPVITREPVKPARPRPGQKGNIGSGMLDVAVQQNKAPMLGRWNDKFQVHDPRAATREGEFVRFDKYEDAKAYYDSLYEKYYPQPAPARRPRQVLEDSEVAVSTFIKRQGGMRIPKELKEEFGGWNRLHKKDAMGADEMAHAAYEAGLIERPDTNALIDGLKSGRKSARVGGGVKASVEDAAERHIAEVTTTPVDLEFKGKTYTGAVREGNDLRLKDTPDKVLKKADDILAVEEKIPFDVPEEAASAEDVYDAARFNDVAAKYREATEAYRARRIGDDEYLAARGALEREQKAFDRAYATAEQETKQTAAERRAASARKVQDLFDKEAPKTAGVQPKPDPKIIDLVGTGGNQGIAQGDTRFLQTPSGTKIAEIKLLSDHGRGFGTYEVVKWLPDDEALPEFATAEGMRTYKEYFQSRAAPRLLSSTTKEVTREGAPNGYLQVASADAKYLGERAPTPAAKQYRTPEGEIIPAERFAERFLYGRHGDASRARAKDVDGVVWEETGYSGKDLEFINIRRAKDQPASKPVPVPRESLSPEELAAQDEMRGLLGGKKEKGPLAHLKKKLTSEEGSIKIGKLRIRDGKVVEPPTTKEVQDAVDQITSGTVKPVSTTRLATGGMFEESSKTLSKTMGEEGTELARLSKAVRNDAEIEAGVAFNRVGEKLEGLTARQNDNLVSALEGEAAPMDAKVKAAFTVAREELDKVAGRAEQVKLQIKNPITGEKTPFQPRENYFPHMFGRELGEYIKDPASKAKLKAQIKAQLEQGGKEVTDKQVEVALQSMLKASRNRYGHLEIARVFDAPDYSRDPRAVLSRHFTDAYRRINIAEKFGPDLERGEELLTAIGDLKGDKAESFARLYFQRVTGTEPGRNQVVREAVNFATNFQAFSKLGQAVIANVSQPAYTAVVTGAKNTVKAYVKAATKEGRKFAEQTGAILNDSMTDFLKDSGARTDRTVMGRAADAVLKYTGFTAAERLNRNVAANAGRYFARETFEKLVANPKHAGLRETLQKMNVDVAGALNRGALSELDELRAGQSIVNRTQFKTDVTEIPLFWASDAGRLVTQFKKFQFKAGQMVKDEILKEMAKGNVLPFVRAAVILPLAGYGVMSARDAIRFGQQRENQETIADYLAVVGTFGAFTDAFAGSGRQPVRGLSYLAGPTLGDAGALWEAATAITREGDVLPAVKFGLRQVPVAGPSLRNMFNPKKKPESEEKKMMRELGLAHQESDNKKLMRELGLQ